MQEFSASRFPDTLRARYLDNDPAAIQAAWNAALTEGAISENLWAWPVRCLIFAAAHDIDFHAQARQAADEIPNAEFIPVEGHDHLGAHLQHDSVIPAVLHHTLRNG